MPHGIPSGLEMISETKNIFDKLRLLIMRGEFKPRERLLERSLAAKFGVSRTPIREALHKLQGIGLVKVIPQQGAAVTDFTLKDLEALYVARLLNEQLAGRLACNLASPIQIKELSKINQEFIEAVQADDFNSMISKDQEFHIAFVRLCGNPFLIKVVENLRQQSYPFSYYFWSGKKNTLSAISQHKKILRVLKSRDSEKMDALIESTLNNSRDRFLKYRSKFEPIG